MGSRAQPWWVVLVGSVVRLAGGSAVVRALCLGLWRVSSLCGASTFPSSLSGGSEFPAVVFSFGCWGSALLGWPCVGSGMAVFCWGCVPWEGGLAGCWLWLCVGVRKFIGSKPWGSGAAAAVGIFVVFPLSSGLFLGSFCGAEFPFLPKSLFLR